MKKHHGFTFFYTPSDGEQKYAYAKQIKVGLQAVTAFFNEPYKNPFAVYIHPNRRSLDSQWQTDWNMPLFHSECWMVTSGVAAKLDLLSPKIWEREACEHRYQDREKTQRLITHELVHVYHGQRNKSPDFSNVEGIDWFVEGLATYVSGQCDSVWNAEVKNTIATNAVPQSLDDFWTGNLKYGLSGSVVLFIDKTFGRNRLKMLLPFTKKAELLAALQITGQDLLQHWKAYFTK